MIDLFMPFRSFLKFHNVTTDNNVFRMHYKITVIMLLVFTLMVTSKQFFGEPIYCMADNEKAHDAINSYCWIYGTYTLRSRLVGKPGQIVYPGVGAPTGVPNEQIMHIYYQWVCFVLLGQAVMFYTPRYMWKLWEGGRLKALASDLSSPMVTKDWSEYRRGELISYLSYTNLRTHNIYAIRYAFCEILNLVNVVGQIYLVDVFLGGSFRDYGASVAAFTHIPRVPPDTMEFDSVNPMDKYFPKMTKCYFKKFGPSGSREYRDYLCVLPLNIVNEKVFVILWFWLIFLALITLLAVVFRVLVFCLPPLRTVMVMGQIRFVKRRVVSRIIRRFSFGDWFILYMLGKNMNPLIYKELIVELSKQLDKDEEGRDDRSIVV